MIWSSPMRRYAIPTCVSRRLFFSSATGSANGNVNKKKKSLFTTIIIRAFRIARVVVVSYGIYQIGYRNGLTDYLEHPEEQQKGLVAAVLSMSNSTKVLEANDPHSTKVHEVAQRILNTARIIAEEDVRGLESEESKVLNSQNNQEDTRGKLEEARVVLRRMSGNWNFFVTDSDEVNAFVTVIMPKAIFVNQGLLTKLEPNTDELAMILAHELSHVIHDHNRERSFAQAAIYIFQLVLFALVDPTGQSSMLFDFVMSKLIDVMLATHSRTNEEEADMTGVKIMSKACFDVIEGSNIFLKLAGLSNSQSSTSWLDTHPNSELRAQYIKEAYELHHPSADCIEMKKNLMKSRQFLKSHSR